MVEHAPTALLLLAAIGFVDGTTDVLFETTAQREADPRYYGAVFGFASTMMAVTMTGAFLAAPLLNNLVDAARVLIGAAGVLGTASAIALVGMRPSRTDVNQVSAAEGPSREDSAASVVALAPTQTAESSVAVTHADDATAGGRHERDVIIVASPSLITRAMELAWEVPSDLTVEIVMLMSGSSSLDGSPDARIVIMLLGADHEEVPAAITPHLKALAAR
jgi:hypothetical protein